MHVCVSECFVCRVCVCMCECVCMCVCVYVCVCEDECLCWFQFSPSANSLSCWIVGTHVYHLH